MLAKPSLLLLLMPDFFIHTGLLAIAALGLGVIFFSWQKAERLQAQQAALADDLAGRELALSTLRAEKEQLSLEKAQLEVRVELLTTSLSERGEQQKQLEETMKLSFQQMAQELLEHKGNQLAHQQNTQLEGLLAPLKERIHLFEAEVRRTHREAMDHKVALRTELERLHQLNQQMSQEAHNLTSALRMNHRLQGQWGEFVLESILERSGLVKGREYFIQASQTGEEGRRLQPDVVIQMPERRFVVVDAKVSLKDFEQFIHATDKKEQEACMHRHLAALRQHIRGLHGKDYAQLYQAEGGLDFVLMFIPLEAAFLLALQEGSALFDEAYQQGILLVSPSTLLSGLRTIYHLWQQQHQSTHALEIAQQGGALYDKFVGFVEDIRKLGSQLQTAQRTHEDALKKLTDGRGNLVERAEQLRALGARARKRLPPTA